MTCSFGRLAARSVAISIVCCTALAQVVVESDLTAADMAAIREVYHLWGATANDIWPGSAATSAPIIYVKQSVEYAIGFPRTLQGFTNMWQDRDLGVSIQSRPRTFAPDITASFPVEGVGAVVIGTAAQLNKSLEAWVVTAEHERFHVYQWANGSGDKVAALHIGGPDAASWQLTYPFPYSDKNVMRLAHLQGYPLWLAYKDRTSEDSLYDVGTALDAVHVYRSVLDGLASKNYFYSEFQEWTEGVAKYTEYRFAECASQTSYVPDCNFRELPAYKGYVNLWNTDYRNLPFLVKHAGRAAQDRNVFYHLGLGKALALDKINPNWKAQYFAKEIWLDDLLATSLDRAK